MRVSIRNKLPWLGIILMGCTSIYLLASAEARVGILLWNTARLAGGVCLLSVPIGTLLALAIFKTNAAGRWAACLVMVAMLFVPLYLQAAAWDAGFGLQGWHTLAKATRAAQAAGADQVETVEPLLEGWSAAIWIHAMAAVPWVVLIVGTGLAAVAPELEEDANLNAGGARVLAHVTLKQAAAPIVVACLWVSLVCAGEIAVTDLFQVRTFAEEVYTQAALGAFDFAPDDNPVQETFGGNESSNKPTDGDDGWTMPARGLFGGVLLTTLLAVLVLAVGRNWIQRWGEPPQRATWIWRLRKKKWLLGIVTWLMLTGIVGLPLGNLVYKAGVRVTSTEKGRVRSWSAPKALERVWAAPWEHSAELWQSAKIGACAATAGVLLAAPLAWSLRKSRATPWLRWTGLMFCLTVPGPLLGIAVIRIMNQPLDSSLSWLTWLYDDSVFGFAPWLVQTIRALPVATIVLWPALASVPQATLDSASCEGAGWWRQLVWIGLAQRWPAVIAAWLLAFAVAVGEVAATVLVTPPGVTPISVRIFTLTHYGVEDRVASIALVMVMGCLALTWAAVAILARGRRDWVSG